MVSFLSGTCDAFGGSGSVVSRLAGFDHVSASASTSTLALLSAFQYNFHPVDSFITFISLQSSYAWYLKLSQFETVFLGLIMLQICFLRYLEILPININNFFLGDPSGRKRRRKRTLGKIHNFDCDADIFTSSLLKVLKKLDDGNCLPLTLCELESMSKPNPSKTNSTVSALNVKLPHETLALLQVLKRLGATRHEQIDLPENIDQLHDPSSYNPVSNCAKLDGLKSYEDAVLLGSSVAASNYHNSTICEERYSACPLTKQDIKHYITILIDAKIL